MNGGGYLVDTLLPLNDLEELLDVGFEKHDKSAITTPAAAG